MKIYIIFWKTVKGILHSLELSAENCFAAKKLAVDHYGILPDNIYRIVEQ